MFTTRYGTVRTCRQPSTHIYILRIIYFKIHVHWILALLRYQYTVVNIYIYQLPVVFIRVLYKLLL